jgi:hypothetical protein
MNGFLHPTGDLAGGLVDRPRPAVGISDPAGVDSSRISLVFQPGAAVADRGMVPQVLLGGLHRRPAGLQALVDPHLAVADLLEPVQAQVAHPGAPACSAR